VHLRGTFLVSRAAARYWESEPGLDPRLVNTASGSGLFGGPRQASYAAAKAGVVALTLVCARELSRYGVLTNALAPVARTRATLGVPSLAAALGDPGVGFDPGDPANVAPVVAYLCSSRCRLNGAVLQAAGSDVGLFQGWSLGQQLRAEGRWSTTALAEAVDEAGWAREPADLLSVAVTLDELLQGALP
jgi:NAD(P)-dependent dehydrogenase (short-subunit alcohol dehydrogenase family)